MAIKRHSCRVTERIRMRKLEAQGKSIPQISNATSVHEHIVDEVLSGRWAASEKKGKIQLKLNNERRAKEKDNEAVVQAAAIAAATVTALRAVESAELSPQQRGAITKKANAAKKAEEEEDKHGQAA